VEATRRIRGLDGGAEVRIVAITAFAYTSDREVLMSAGFDDLVFKPFRPAELFACIACHLGLRYLSPEEVGNGIGVSRSRFRQVGRVWDGVILWQFAHQEGRRDCRPGVRALLAKL
jgi:DNA-binding response OmpR family regulator